LDKNTKEYNVLSDRVKEKRALLEKKREDTKTNITEKAVYLGSFEEKINLGKFL